MSRKAFVSGAFDLLHSGHVAFLTEAASHGDLYVCIGNDECVFRLKGRYPVNPQDERKYLIDSLRCVKECRISRGMGLLDFVDELRDIKPDVFVVNEDGAHESKAQLCREMGIEDPRPAAAAARRPPGPEHHGPPRRVHHPVPHRSRRRMARPAVRVRFHPGAVLTISIEPTHEFDNRSGMASSTRNRGIELWRTALPQGNKEQVAKILFSYENPPVPREVAGSQDSIGIVYPGLNRLDYNGAYWPYAIESVDDEEVLAWLERRLHLVPLGPEGRRVQRARRDARDRRGRAVRSPRRPTTAGRPSCAMDVTAFGRAFTASFDAQVAMFPNMANQAIYDLIDAYRGRRARLEAQRRRRRRVPHPRRRRLRPRRHSGPHPAAIRRVLTRLRRGPACRFLPRLRRGSLASRLSPVACRSILDRPVDEISAAPRLVCHGGRDFTFERKARRRGHPGPGLGALMWNTKAIPRPLSPSGIVLSLPSPSPLEMSPR